MDAYTRSQTPEPMLLIEGVPAPSSLSFTKGKLFYRTGKQIRSYTISTKRDEFVLETFSDEPITELDVKQVYKDYHFYQIIGLSLLLALVSSLLAQGSTPEPDAERGYMILTLPEQDNTRSVSITNLYHQPDLKLKLRVKGYNVKVDSSENMLYYLRGNKIYRRGIGGPGEFNNLIMNPMFNVYYISMKTNKLSLFPDAEETEVASSGEIKDYSIDGENGRLYYLDTKLNEIFRVNLRNVNNVIRAYTGLRNPRSINAYDKLVEIFRTAEKWPLRIFYK